MLVEFDAMQWANYTQEVLFQVQLLGVVPVLAHVDRIVPLQENLAYLEELVEHGALAQVTATSVAGGFGARARHAAEEMLRRGLVHILASDTHRPTGLREPFLASAASRVTELVGADATHALLYDNPASIIADGPVSPISPQPPRGGLLRRLFR